MGKRGGGIKKAENGPSKFQMQQTISLLREEGRGIGKKQTKGGAANVKAILKQEHLKNLAVWASGEASIPSLASFFGHRLAADGEAAAIPPDPSFFPCQRCETILRPGFNCTVRIEKNGAKSRHRCTKPRMLTHNSVVYNCHFCWNRNLKRGTPNPKGNMKEMYPPKLKASSIPKAVKSTLDKSVASSGKDELDKVDHVISSPAAATATAKDSTTDGPTTPLSKGRTLLDGIRKRNRSKSGSKKQTSSI